MRKTLFLLMWFLVGIGLQAQESGFSSHSFQGTRFVNSQSVNLAEKGELHLLIQHRFGDISGGFYDLFGLDQASMRLGFEYGFGNDFNMGVGRSTYLKTFDGFAKYRFLRQDDDIPFSLVITAGGSVPTLKGFFPEGYNSFSKKVSGNVQLHIARTMGRIGIQLSPGFLKTGYLHSLNKDVNTVHLNMGGSVRISEKVSANLEYLHAFNSEMDGKMPVSTGIDIDTGGHLFQLVLSNSQAMFDQALFTNVTGDWGKGKLYFGFNLIREFDINKPLDF